MPGERSRGRRGGGPELIRISWRDIPAQLNARANRETMQHVLPRRFQKGIDRAAMVAGRKSANDYVSEWGRSSAPLDLDSQENRGLTLEQIVRREGAAVEEAYPMPRIDELVRTGGWTPDRADLPELLAADAAWRVDHGDSATPPVPEADDDLDDLDDTDYTDFGNASRTASEEDLP